MRFLEMKAEIVLRYKSSYAQVSTSFNSDYFLWIFFFKGSLNINSKEDLILSFWTAYI